MAKEGDGGLTSRGGLPAVTLPHQGETPRDKRTRGDSAPESRPRGHAPPQRAKDAGNSMSSESEEMAAEVMNDPAIKALEPQPEVKEEKPVEQPEPKQEEAKAEEPKAERKPRNAEVVPITRFHEVRHELNAEKEARKRLEEELATLKSAPSAAPDRSIDERAMSYSEKHGLTFEAARDFLTDTTELAASRMKPSVDPTLEQRLAAIEADRKKAADEIAYRNEEDATLSRYPELKPYAKDLKTLAYTQGNESIPLEYLAAKLKVDLNLTEAAAPAEGSSAPSSNVTRDYDKLTDEDMEKLSPAELDAVIARNRMKR